VLSSIILLVWLYRARESCGPGVNDSSSNFFSSRNLTCSLPPTSISTEPPRTNTLLRNYIEIAPHKPLQTHKRASRILKKDGFEEDQQGESRLPLILSLFSSSSSVSYRLALWSEPRLSGSDIEGFLRKTFGAGMSMAKISRPSSLTSIG
jgi:hypothetical protein